MNPVTPELVSTVLPVHNRRTLLGEAVTSVLGQSYRPIEIIIVDDGSTDDTLEAARSMACEQPSLIRVLTQRRAGPGAARERGRRAVRGEFVQYLDSDDLLAPDKFERQVAALRNDPGADISYGGTRRYRRGGTVTDRHIRATGCALERLFPNVLQARLWATSTPLYRRSLVERAGAWQPLWAEEDWEYDCRMATLSPRLHYVAASICDVRDHEHGQMHRNESLRLERFRDMARARELILNHARCLDTTGATYQYQHLLRAVFLLARQCAALGLEPEARRLLALLRGTPASVRWRQLDVRLYDTLSRVAGYRTLGRLSAQLDRVRDRLKAAAP